MPDLYSDLFKTSELHEAALEGDAARLRALLQAGANPNERACLNSTPLKNFHDYYKIYPYKKRCQSFVWIAFAILFWPAPALYAQTHSTTTQSSGTAAPPHARSRKAAKVSGRLWKTLPTIEVGVTGILPTIFDSKTPVELLVASCDTGSVKRFDGRTGTFRDDFIYGNGMVCPKSLVIGPDGDL